jgi:hypothetical protein
LEIIRASGRCRRKNPKNSRNSCPATCFLPCFTNWGHAAINQFDLQVLGKEEDATDSVAATRLIRIGSEFSDQVVASAAQAWFLIDRRDRKEGETVPYYDEHGFDQQRAYQIVCFVVGSNESKFKKLADETKLPDDRRDSCANDFRTAIKSWDPLLKPHMRAPDQPPTKIDVIYGQAEGRLALTAQISRVVNLLENVAHHASDLLAWPAPFTLEMRTCGRPLSHIRRCAAEKRRTRKPK